MKKNITTIEDWKNFYKEWQPLSNGSLYSRSPIDGLLGKDIPYRPDLTYKGDWVSYLYFTGKSFFDLHPKLIESYSPYVFESYITFKFLKSIQKRLVNKSYSDEEVSDFLSEFKILENVQVYERIKGFKKEIDKLNDGISSLRLDARDVFWLGYNTMDNFYNILKSLPEDSTKMIDWHCKACGKNFTRSVKDLVQETTHKECDNIKGPEPIYYDEDCKKCKDGLIPNHDLESYSYCDCDYAKSLEDHPDNYQPPEPEPIY